MNKEKDYIEPALGFFGVVLPFIFAGLQIFGVINWSWWIIFSPTIILCLVGTYAMIDLPRVMKKLEKEQQDFLNDIEYFKSDKFKEDIRRQHKKIQREERLKKLNKINQSK